MVVVDKLRINRVIAAFSNSGQKTGIFSSSGPSNSHTTRSFLFARRQHEANDHQNNQRDDRPPHRFRERDQDFDGAWKITPKGIGHVLEDRHDEQQHPDYGENRSYEHDYRVNHRRPNGRARFCHGPMFSAAEIETPSRNPSTSPTRTILIIRGGKTLSRFDNAADNDRPVSTSLRTAAKTLARAEFSVCSASQKSRGFTRPASRPLPKHQP